MIHDSLLSILLAFFYFRLCNEFWGVVVATIGSGCRFIVVCEE